MKHIIIPKKGAPTIWDFPEDEEHFDQGGVVGGAVGGAAGTMVGGPVGGAMGAAAGSAIGNNVGGWAGGAANGISGAFGALSSDIAGRTKAPNYPGYNIDQNAFNGGGASPTGSFMGGESSLAAQLASEAAGGGPNLANEELKMATDRNMAQAAGLQASARGVDPALAMRNVASNQSSLAGQAAAQASVNRMQQQLAAQQEEAGVLNAGAQQQIGGQQLGVQNALGAQGIQQTAATARDKNNQGLLGMGEGIASGALSAIGASKGRVVPGRDTGVDTVHAMLRPGEVVVNPERPMAYAAALSQPDSPQGPGKWDHGPWGGEDASISHFDDGGAAAMPAPAPTPTSTPWADNAAPSMAPAPEAPTSPAGRMILDWLRKKQRSAEQILSGSDGKVRPAYPPVDNGADSSYYPANLAGTGG